MYLLAISLMEFIFAIIIKMLIVDFNPKRCFSNSFIIFNIISKFTLIYPNELIYSINLKEFKNN